jgi:hypothetical protein
MKPKNWLKSINALVLLLKQYGKLPKKEISAIYYVEAKKIVVPADKIETNKLLGKPLTAAVMQWQCHRYMELFVINIKDALKNGSEIRPLIIDIIKRIRKDKIMGECTQEKALKREETSSSDDMTLKDIYYILYGLPYPSNTGYTWN